MKKYTFNDWCKTDWLKCSLIISGFMLVLILINWNNWSLSLKCIAAIAALVPVHATEEWIFPGGFAFQYNLFLNHSEYPHCYPMNRASDMITVLGTTIMYALITLYCAITGTAVPSGILLGAALFSALEVSVHTFFGIKAYFKYKDAGKTTIYGTGSMTAYNGFLMLGIIMLRQIISLGISGKDIIWCILILGITNILCFIPEIKFKVSAYQFKDKNSPYAYENMGIMIDLLIKAYNKNI